MKIKDSVLDFEKIVYDGAKRVAYLYTSPIPTITMCSDYKVPSKEKYEEFRDLVKGYFV